MFKLLERIRIRTRLNLLVIFSAIPLIVLFVMSIIGFNRIRNNWDHFYDVVYQKHEYLNDITAELGYGGFIHLYKNYIISGKLDLYELIFQKHQEIKLLISDYISIGELTEEELESINDLQQMIDLYISKLPDIKKMKSEGMDPYQIDSAINIDYSSYALNLEYLQDTLSGHTIEEGNILKSILNIAVIVFPSVIGLIFLDVITSGIFISFSITKRINAFINKYKMGMKGDLTIRMETDDSKNEINILARYFNEFMDMLSGLIKEVKFSINNTKKISTNLSSSSVQSNSAIMEIRTNIEGMRNKTSTLDKEISMSKETIKDVNRFISEVVNMINNQASAMSESSASIEEMSASIQNIAQVSEQKLKITNELEEKANMGENEMRKSMETINRVADSANVIVEMMNVINNIAGQTDLLAMNASIEAAHAGEAGKGFAVVADEIRNLAESTTENSKNISESLKKIINDIKNSEESTTKTSSFFHNIVDGIKGVANGMNEMRNTTQELASGSNQVLKSLSSLVSVTDNVKSSSEEMNDKIKGVETSIISISNISLDVKNGMREVSDGISELSIISKNVSEEGSNNMDSVATLEEQINKIITDESKKINPPSENNQKEKSDESVK